MILTREQRQVFIAWLQQTASDNKGLAGQMDSLPSMAQLAKVYRAKASAMEIVAMELIAVEDASL